MAESDNEIWKIFKRILDIYSYGVLLTLIGLDLVATETDVIGAGWLLGATAFFLVVFLDGWFTPKSKRRPVYTLLAALLAAYLISAPTATFSLLAFGSLTIVKMAREL